MNKKILSLLMISYSSIALSEIVPDIKLPSDFNENNFFINTLKNGGFEGYNQSSGSSCGDVTFKDFTPKPYLNKKDNKNNPVYKGITYWYCNIESVEKEDGYGPGRLLPEKVYFDEKSGAWKKKKYRLSREDIKESFRGYGIHSLKELKPVTVYNIESVNAKGYAVIDSNIPKEDRDNGVKSKTISFCLIRDGEALCGYGPLVYTFDGKDVDFTPYILKSLETVEMGLPEKTGN